MTTKWKIIVGFTLMVLLLAGIAAMGVTDLRRAGEVLLEYRRIARANVDSGDLATAVNASVYDVYVFLDVRDDAWMQKAVKQVETAFDEMQKIRRDVRAADNVKLLEDIDAALKEYSRDIALVQANYLGGLKVYTDTVLPSLDIVSDELAEMQTVGVGSDNLPMIDALTAVWVHFARVRSASSRFYMTREKDDAEAVVSYGKKLREHLDALGGTTRSERGRAAFGKLDKAAQEGQAALDRMIAQYAVVQSNIEKMNKNVDEMRIMINKVNVSLDAQMVSLGRASEIEADTSMKEMIGISVAGLIIGLLSAVFIIFSFVRILAKVGSFAGAIAQGDFNSRAEIMEKGEIGSMVAALYAIPSTLNTVLETYKTLARRITQGNLAARGEVEKFKGDFATLVRGTNDALGAFRTIIDNIPSPVVMLDADTKAEYLNNKAVELAGSDYRGKYCKQLFNREDDGSRTDALQSAVKAKKPASSETRAHPGGKTLDIAYTAIPMLDVNGNLDGVLQLITDLTSIKETQRTIQDVAAQAASIAARVASASEELSAQVDQVSKGAEIQRSRVESTATAMSEMNSTVLEVARNAGAASEQSEGTRRKADDGAELVNKVVRSINGVNSVALTLQDSMTGLGQQAESIGGVMNVISDIADQTNLLALNAAIEAARAGEAGRGFAVVADEVRKLAEKTMGATQEVGGSIQAIQNSARANISEVTTAVKNIGEATDLANASGQALHEIVELASSNSALVASIATAAEEQSATSEEINSSLEAVSRVVAETAEGMTQSASAVQELSHMAQELTRVMGRLHTQA